MARCYFLSTTRGAALTVVVSGAAIATIYILFSFLFWQLPNSVVFFPQLSSSSPTGSTSAASNFFNYWAYRQPDGSDHKQEQLHAAEDGGYLLGVGKADITGPVVEIDMMGYADPDQVGSGLRQRLYCRAFIIANHASSSSKSGSGRTSKNAKEGSEVQVTDRLLYLVLDTQSGDTAIRDGILTGLANLGDEYRAHYTKDNLAVTGTHSHAGPGGWLNYLLPQITSKGFDRASYQAIVDGSLLAIRRAHESLVPGNLYLGATEVEDVNLNRSPYAYDANPDEEKARYDSNVDKTMTLLRFDRAKDQKPMGVLTWFAVHGTSLYGNNTLIAGDNKGVAAYLFERYMSSTNPEFVAGFSQANVGDSSPNILGAFCDDTGLPCRYNDSTCAGDRIDTCHGRGPYFDVDDQGTKSCFEIGRRQFASAKRLFSHRTTKAAFPRSSTLQRLQEGQQSSTISSIHTFANLSSYTFQSPLRPSKLRKTCSGALGHAFAAGTTDGPGRFDFRQGTTNDSSSPSTRNPLWMVAREFVHEPDEAQIECQSPKAILLDVGAAEHPYAWSPDVMDIQLLRVGPLIIIVSPGEATTMSGRRWREAVASAAASVLGIPRATVVLGGPANTYAHYIATEEEYGVQRYEGASTLHGPHTLEAYISLALSYLPFLDPERQKGGRGGKKNPPQPDSDPSPPINTNRSLSFINPVIFDAAPVFKSFGDVLSNPTPPRQDLGSSVFAPGDTVSTRFVGANPRNNFRLEGTFAAVEKLTKRNHDDDNDDAWQVIRTDKDWNLVFRWERKITVLGTSEVVVEWEIESELFEDEEVREQNDDDDGDDNNNNNNNNNNKKTTISSPGGVGAGQVWNIEDGIYRLRYFGDAKGIDGQVTPFEGVGGEFRVVKRRSLPP